MVSGPGVDVQQIVRICQVNMLVDEVGETLGPLVVDIKIVQEREFLFSLCYTSIKSHPAGDAKTPDWPRVIISVFGKQIYEQKHKGTVRSDGANGDSDWRFAGHW